MNIENRQGLLGRLHVQALTITHIGKETNLLEAQEEGVLVNDPQVVYWDGSEWEAIRPWLQDVSITRLAELSGVSPRMLRDIRQGTRRGEHHLFFAHATLGNAEAAFAHARQWGAGLGWLAHLIDHRSTVNHIEGLRDAEGFTVFMAEVRASADRLRRLYAQEADGVAMAGSP